MGLSDSKMKFAMSVPSITSYESKNITLLLVGQAIKLSAIRLLSSPLTKLVLHFFIQLRSISGYYFVYNTLYRRDLIDK